MNASITELPVNAFGDGGALANALVDQKGQLPPLTIDHHHSVEEEEKENQFGKKLQKKKTRGTRGGRKNREKKEKREEYRESRKKENKTILGIEQLSDIKRELRSPIDLKKRSDTKKTYDANQLIELHKKNGNQVNRMHIRTKTKLRL